MKPKALFDENRRAVEEVKMEDFKNLNYETIQVCRGFWKSIVFERQSIFCQQEYKV